jgi:hypothetical protein
MLLRDDRSEQSSGGKISKILSRESSSEVGRCGPRCKLALRESAYCSHKLMLP